MAIVSDERRSAIRYGSLEPGAQLGEVIERAAGRLIRRRNREAAAVALVAALRDMTKVARRRDRVAISDADPAFHEVLVRSSGSPRVARMAETLLVETRICLRTPREHYPEPAELVEKHSALVDAIAADDEPLLLRLIEEHMTESVDRLAPARQPGSGRGGVLK